MSWEDNTPAPLPSFHQDWKTWAQEMLVWLRRKPLSIGVAATTGGGVPATRLINTNLPLTGGGDLSVDRTHGVNDFIASGALHARGTVPTPGAVAGATRYLREDATWVVPPAGAGGGGSGVTTIDFGAFPGGYSAQVAVIGQAGIVAGSVIQAWIQPAATADHSADEHLAEFIQVFAGNISAGVGFTIYGLNNTSLFSKDTNVGASPSSVDAAGVGVAANYLGRVGGRGQLPNNYLQVPRVYGIFTVGWRWS